MDKSAPIVVAAAGEIGEKGCQGNSDCNDDVTGDRARIDLYMEKLLWGQLAFNRLLKF